MLTNGLHERIILIVKKSETKGKAMSVYIILYSVDYEGSEVEGVYSSREEAERECERLNSENGYRVSERYVVEEWEVR